MRRALLALLVVPWLAVGCGPRHPSDGATSHHPFDDVPRWVAVFDDPARDAWQRPADLVRALGVRPGMRVADVGAGTGYMSRHLAAAVGPTGTVFAVDTEPNLVEYLRERARWEETPNVVPVLGAPDDPRLPAGGVDLLLLVDTYHHVDHRVHWFQRARAVLAPGGQAAVVDWRKEPLPVGPPPDHKLDRGQVVDEMTRAGWTLVAEPDVLPYQYVLVFAP